MKSSMLKSRKYFKYTSLHKTFLLYRMTAFIKKTFKNCVPKYELFLNFLTLDSFVIPFHIDKIDFITWNYHSKIKLSVNSFRRIKNFICFSFTNLFSVHFLLFHDISRNSFQRRQVNIFLMPYETSSASQKYYLRLPISSFSYPGFLFK